MEKSDYMFKVNSTPVSPPTGDTKGWIKARKYVVVKHFDGMPKRDDFEIVEHYLPPLQDGEILVKTEWISVDPYLRMYNVRYPTPYDQFSYQVGTILETKDSNYPIGTKVVSHKGWCDFYVTNTSSFNNPSEMIYKLPNMQGLSDTLGIGAVGMIGATAYFGFLEICHPKPGETVVVTGAAGAVGSLVGQIAKIKGCKVIGFAGSDDKVAWLEKIGFDKAINYKTANINQALKEAAPDGVDCYFDNVGGEISSTIIYQMNRFGRVSVCGSISSYNCSLNNLPKATVIQPAIVAKEIKMEGFLILRWYSRISEAYEQMLRWILDGKIQTKEHITNGFENVFDAFVGMLSGNNIGKAIVKI